MKRTAEIFSVSFGGSYTDNDFLRMAEKLDLLIIDPLNFPQVPGILKRTNPEIKVLGYCNTFDMQDMSPYEGRQLTPGGKTERMLQGWKEADAVRHEAQGVMPNKLPLNPVSGKENQTCRGQ